MGELIIEINDKGYKVITCTEGYCFTNWNREDITEFSTSKLMYAPLDFDMEGYYCIDDEEAAVLESQKDEEIMKMEKEQQL